MNNINTKPAQDLEAGKLDESSLPVNRVSEGDGNKTVVRTGAIKKIILGSIAILGIGLVAVKHVSISQNDSKLAVVADVTLKNIDALGMCEAEVNGKQVVVCEGNNGSCTFEKKVLTYNIKLICDGKETKAAKDAKAKNK